MRPLVLVLCVAAVVTVAHRLAAGPAGPAPSAPTPVDGDPRTQRATFADRPIGEFVFARGVFESVDHPRMVPAATARWMRPDAVVYGIVVDGVARAYPLSELAWCHVVNDRVVDRPVAITYCMACASALAFACEVEGRALTLAMDGAWRATATLFDRESDSVWHQITGRCIAGPHRGAVLEKLPGRRATWAAWCRDHPETTVMREADGALRKVPVHQLERKPIPSRMAATLAPPDSRLGRREAVFGVTTGTTARAYPVAALRPVVEEEVAGIPITIWREAHGESTVVFDRRVAARRLAFECRAGRWFDTDTGSTWTLDGVCVAGPLRGQTLVALRGHVSHWYAWSTVYPETTVWRRP